MNPKPNIESLLPRSFGFSTHDTSVEYAVAYVLFKAGVKKLSFGSWGPPKSKEIGLTSITATPGVRFDDSTLLISVLRHFEFCVGGGASFDNPRSYMQASFVFQDKPSYSHRYIKGRRLRSWNQDQFFTMVYSIFGWLTENFIPEP